ncbi:hypothetical protein AUP74_02021 [Microbulbifer aggregans]|uniref:Uncharacterized protein n=1 Tax=Microbulbifer aggregans TaxID=1769779 RepID=A0A1C9W8I2_9GAMM|nr:hypothetical protein AUP74_02021 [Microbulbifer aggregans]
MACAPTLGSLLNPKAGSHLLTVPTTLLPCNLGALPGGVTTPYFLSIDIAELVKAFIREAFLIQILNQV